MASIYLISCTKQKSPTASRAKDLYQSPLFNKSKRVAELSGDDWFVLSAKHGLLPKEEEIEPYDVTLHNFSNQERREWAKDVSEELESVLEENDTITLLAGETYREYLVPILRQAGYAVSIPMEGKPLGHQLRWLNSRIDCLETLQVQDRFYSLLERISEGSIGPVKMRETDGHMDWPEKGVYFFLEPGEYRDTDLKTKRVVRVGTHAVSSGSKTSLWDRLRTHRGTEKGSGNHRASIFRLHLGEALMERDNLSVPTWGKKQRPNQIPKDELVLENRVSEIIGDMEVMCVEILDDAGPNSDRAFIERNSIALLSGYQPPFDSPSEDWLGYHSTRETIRKSGLWNVNHVTEEYDSRFLDVFERYVESTIGEADPPDGRIAPTKPKNQVTLEQYLDDQ